MKIIILGKNVTSSIHQGGTLHEKVNCEYNPVWPSKFHSEQKSSQTSGWNGAISTIKSSPNQSSPISRWRACGAGL